VKEVGASLASRWWSAFTGLPADHPAVLGLAAASQKRSLAAGEALVTEGDRDGTVFLLIAGALRTVRHTRNGHEVWLADVQAGDITGDMAALTGAPRTSSVVAKNGATVFGISRETFVSIANTHAEFAVVLARMLAARLHTTSTHLAELVALPVSTRLHGELASVGAATDDPEVFVIQPPPKVTSLSHRVHATREATSRAVTQLAQRGFLVRGRGKWKIVVPSNED
jgi:CRP/FNR family cyclic AMP-dependent transcriptional regulator